jgi:hypothetical protein
MSEKKCAKCSAAVEPDEVKEFRGEELCEDCYMDALTPTVVCDPWAVHTAKSLKDIPGGDYLTPTQQKLFNLVQERGEVPMAEAAAQLGLSEEGLRREFAPLRHMEKLRACKKDDTIYLAPF